VHNHPAHAAAITRAERAADAIALGTVTAATTVGAIAAAVTLHAASQDAVAGLVAVLAGASVVRVGDRIVRQITDEAALVDMLLDLGGDDEPPVG